MKWNLMTKWLRRSSRPCRPIRRTRTFRPTLEHLETRLAPANVPVLSGHYDPLLSGANTQETALNPTNVNDASFGKLFNYQLDGYAYAQPLYMPNLNIPGKGVHNVVFVATEHDTLYAFDADNSNPATGGGLLWQRSFIDPTNGITTMPSGETFSGDIVPEIGITGTPVIDGATNTLYLVAKTKEVRTGDPANAHYVQKLYTIDITTGADKVAPVTIGDSAYVNGTNTFVSNTTAISVPGTGAGSVGGVLSFDARKENDRMSLQLVTNADNSKTVYLAYASHGDNGPYHGWVLGYNAASLALQKVFNTAPNGSASGIWESGGNIGVDPQGNLYFSTGNGFGTGNDVNGGPRALGTTGGGLGYGSSGTGQGQVGISNSAAVTFRAFDHSSTGLAENGNATEVVSNNLTGSSINFNAGAQATPPHTFQAHLTYDSTTHTLTEVLTDLTGGGTPVTETYNVNLEQLVGGNTAFVGFTGGTGGLNAQQDILSWTFNGGNLLTAPLTANGAASIVSPTDLRLTTAQNNGAGSIFTNSQQTITNLDTTFTFQMSAGSSPIADGMTFTIQNKPQGSSYSESVLKLNSQATGTSLPVSDFFTPNDWKTLDNADADLGSGGTLLLPDAVGSAAHPHLIIETGKTGRLYLIDRDHMGENVPAGSADQILQTVTIGGPGVWGNAAFLQDGPNTGLIYYWGSSSQGQAFRITNGVINPTPISKTALTFAFPGSQPSISSNGTDGTSAIMWAIRDDNFGQNGPESLLAYNAEDLTKLLWTSNDVSGRDAVGGTSVKFVFPTVSNGHVYVGSNGSLAVYGLLPANTVAPATPGNFQVTQLSGTQGGDTKLQLSWTNSTPNNATEIKIERSTDGTTFTQIAIVGGDQTSFTDSGLSPVTHYFYRIRATNQIGDSAYTPVADAFTRLSGSKLSVTNVTSGEVDLSWTSVLTSAAGNHYDIERSTDNFATFTTIASNLAPNQTSFVDSTVVRPNIYEYRVHAFSTSPADDSLSNVVTASVAPVDIEFPFPGGIQSPAGLQFNGSAIYSADEQLFRLNNDFSQAGSVFTTDKVSDTNFSTTFWVRLHEGTQPNPADGLTFTIQADPRGASALGGGGGALGYQGIKNSVAIKFDVFNNSGETNNSTGLFFNGDMPDVPHAPGEVNVPLDPNVVNLRDQHRKRVDISYDSSSQQLNVTITDETKIDDGVPGPNSVHQTYNVDIPGIIGTDGAYVGFTGGTGGLFSLQDITGWVFPPTAPAGPSNLQGTAGANNDVLLNWKLNSTNENGFTIERSLDNFHFTQIGQVGAGVSTFDDTDPTLVPNTAYFYRVTAFNDVGASFPSNTVQVSLGATVVTIDHSLGFASHGDLQANGNATFVDPAPAAGTLGIFTAHQDIGVAGNPSPAGNTTFSNGTYTLTASGSDIWDTADHMQYVYKQLTGDGEIVARVASLNNTDFWSKAGIMIRQDTTAGSQNAFMLETGPNNIGGAGSHNEPVFQWRDTANGGSADFGNHVNNIQAAPVWLRLVRSGNTFSGYWAHDNGDGTHGPWNDIGGNTHNITMTGPVLVGLGLTAHNNGTTATATFDHVTVVTDARLTDGGGSEASSIFTTTPVPVTGTFNTSFVLNARSVSGSADGVDFVLQADPRGASALGGGGGAQGYGGIANSIAVKFDLYTHGTHKASTGLFINGQAPDSAPSQDVDMSAAGIDFSQNHTYQVDLSYDGFRLSESIKDLVSGKTFTTSYVLNLRQTIGSDTALVGFTGGTGGETAVLAIPSWTATFNSVAAPPHLEVTNFPTATTSGEPSPFTVTAKTAGGNVIQNYTGTVHFTSGDPNAILPSDYTFTAADHGTHTFAAVLITVGTDSIIATDNSPLQLTDAEGDILVNPASFVVTGFPSEVTAGTAHPFTITAKDFFGNTATGYTGTVHFSSTDASASFADNDGTPLLGSNYTFTTADAGTHTFNGTLVTAGTQSITVADPKTPAKSTGTQSGIQVDPAAFNNFVVAGFPSTTQAGVAGTFTVTAEDQFGNTVTGYTGTVHLTSTDGSATFANNDGTSLPGNSYAFTTADAGVHTFSATLGTLGLQSITATDMGTGFSGSETNILVTPGVAVGLSILGVPDAAVNGTPYPIIVQAVDAYGNANAVYTGTVQFTFLSSSGSGSAVVLPNPYTFVTGDGGQHSFMVTFNGTSGDVITLTVTDSLDPTITASDSVVMI